MKHFCTIQPTWNGKDLYDLLQNSLNVRNCESFFFAYKIVTLLPQKSHRMPRWNMELNWNGLSSFWSWWRRNLCQFAFTKKKSYEFGEVGGVLGVLVVLSTIYKETFHMKGPCLKMGRAHNLAGSAGNHPALLHACWLSDSCAQSFHEIGTITITEELRVLIQDFSLWFF